MRIDPSIHMCAHAQMDIYVCAYVQTIINSTHACMFMHIYTYMYVCMYTFIRTYVCVNMQSYTHTMHSCMYIHNACMHIYVYTHIKVLMYTYMGESMHRWPAFGTN